MNLPVAVRQRLAGLADAIVAFGGQRFDYIRRAVSSRVASRQNLRVLPTIQGCPNEASGKARQEQEQNEGCQSTYRDQGIILQSCHNTPPANVIHLSANDVVKVGKRYG